MPFLLTGLFSDCPGNQLVANSLAVHLTARLLPLLRQTIPHVGHHRLWFDVIPQAIRGNDDELDRAQVVLRHIWKHTHLVQGQLLAHKASPRHLSPSFEGQVAEGARDGQNRGVCVGNTHTLYPSLHPSLATRSLNPCFF